MIWVAYAGMVIFVAGMALYVLQPPHQAGPAALLRRWRAHQRNDRQGARGLLLAPEEGGWTGPARDDRLALYATGRPRSWLAYQTALSRVRRSEDRQYIAAWHEENQLALAGHAQQMSAMAQEWKQFASMRAGYRKEAEAQ